MWILIQRWAFFIAEVISIAILEHIYSYHKPYKLNTLKSTVKGFSKALHT